MKVRASAVAVREVARARELAAGTRVSEPVGTEVAGRIEPRVPPALLGEVAVAQVVHVPILPGTSPRIAREPGAQRANAEPPEVHVHIGRIEVIAPPAPAKPEKRPRVPRGDTRPLSEYLARRRPA